MLSSVASSGGRGPNTFGSGKVRFRGGGFAICAMAPKKILNNMGEVVPSPSRVSSLIDVSPSELRAKVEL